MASKDHRPELGSRGVDATAIERSNQVMRQLVDVGIRVGGYSLGRKLDGAAHSPEISKQGPLGTVAQDSSSLSRMASPKVGSPTTSCECSKGGWEGRIVPRRA